MLIHACCLTCPVIHMDVFPRHTFFTYIFNCTHICMQKIKCTPVAVSGCPSQCFLQGELLSLPPVSPRLLAPGYVAVAFGRQPGQNSRGHACTHSGSPRGSPQTWRGATGSELSHAGDQFQISTFGPGSMCFFDPDNR